MDLVLSVKERLLNAACRRLTTEGLASLQARSVAADVGLSTSALYTHFGSMPALISAVADRLFGEFALAIAAPGTTDDPVADLLAMGLAFRTFAVTRPNEYALLFTQPGLPGRPGARSEVVRTSQDRGTPAAKAAFGVLVDTTQRLVDSDRVGDADATTVATQFWAAIHGYVSLELTGHLDPATDLAAFASLFITQLIGLGDTAERVGMSLSKAVARVPSGVMVAPDPL